MFRALFLTLFVAACTTGPAPTGSPDASLDHTPRPDGVAGLVRELASSGAEVSEADAFDAMPISDEGVSICVEGEPVNVYVFASEEAAASQAAMIDRRDPSKVGRAIIEWAGSPKFWLYGPLLVLYLGNNTDVTQTLTDALGEPFASGHGRPPLRGDDGC